MVLYKESYRLIYNWLGKTRKILPFILTDGTNDLLHEILLNFLQNETSDGSRKSLYNKSVTILQVAPKCNSRHALELSNDLEEQLNDFLASIRNVGSWVRIEIN